MDKQKMNKRKENRKITTENVQSETNKTTSKKQITRNENDMNETNANRKQDIKSQSHQMNVTLHLYIVAHAYINTLSLKQAQIYMHNLNLDALHFI